MNLLHKEEPKNNTSNILLGVIIALLLVIAVGAFFLGQMLASQKHTANTWTNQSVNVTDNSNSTSASMNVVVIDDQRCINCTTNEIVESLKGVPGLSSANFTIQEFSEDGVSDYLKENNISLLPAFIFPTNYVDPGLNQYLEKRNEGVYLLNTSSEFDPFAKRSEKGYSMVSEADLAILNEETKYTKGASDSPYVWLEYTNFACPACEQFHKSGIHDTVLAEYGEDIKYATKHFHFFDGAYEPSELIECVADQLGEEAFYSIERNIFNDSILDVEVLKQKAAELWANVSEIETCMASDKHIATRESVRDNGSRIFGVSATPTNILFNMETGEYIKTQNVPGDIEAFIK